ncbi:MAG: hypothetical protein OXG78_08160 [Chloroflexi bacterium]|nr:hypothetical protein [Chloroflexota bacterium]
MSGLAEQVQQQRDAIVALASEHHVREIAFCGSLSGFAFFLLEVEPSYKVRNRVRLAGELSELPDTPVVLYDGVEHLDGWSELLRE